MDWMTASEYMNRFARLDRDLARRLNGLSQHQAHESKLAFAIESGRIYGLRAQKCDIHLKRQLPRVWQQAAPVEKMW